MDIGLNDNFDVTFDDRNDLPTVTGRAKFEQRLRISVTSFFQTVIGDLNRPATIPLIEEEARRIAREYDVIQRIAQVSVEYDSDEPNILNLTVIYDTGDELSFPISE